jgi:predicted enzyme related to lactoylglutathione lyase
MTLARWQDLCVDAADTATVAAFWAPVLSLETSFGGDGDAVMRGATPEETVWINRVPEPKSVKNRVHLDLVRHSREELIVAGAHVVQEVQHASFSWTVLTDPEGAEFCLFDGDDAPSALVVDSADPVTDATWWAEALGGRLLEAPEGLRRWVDVPGMPFDVLKFVGVAEPKTVKNRVHWDVTSDALPGLVQHGATVLREPDDDVHWHVLADPAGNEFCVMAPKGPDT